MIFIQIVLFALLYLWFGMVGYNIMPERIGIKQNTIVDKMVFVIAWPLIVIACVFKFAWGLLFFLSDYFNDV